MFKLQACYSKCSRNTDAQLETLNPPFQHIKNSSVFLSPAVSRIINQLSPDWRCDFPEFPPNGTERSSSAQLGPVVTNTFSRINKINMTFSESSRRWCSDSARHGNRRVPCVTIYLSFYSPSTFPPALSSVSICSSPPTTSPFFLLLSLLSVAITFLL